MWSGTLICLSDGLGELHDFVGEAVGGCGFEFLVAYGELCDGVLFCGCGHGVACADVAGVSHEAHHGDFAEFMGIEVDIGSKGGCHCACPDGRSEHDEVEVCGIGASRGNIALTLEECVLDAENPSDNAATAGGIGEFFDLWQVPGGDELFGEKLACSLCVSGARVERD